MKKKLLVVADTYHPKVDGTLRFIEEFVPRAKEQFALSLLVPSFGGRRVAPEDIPTTFIDTSRWISLSGYYLMRFSWKNIQKIRRAVAENDIIFIQGPAFISYFATFFGRRAKKKVVTYIHVVPWELYEKFLPPFVNWFAKHFIKRLSLWLYNHCDLVIVPYQGLRPELYRSGITTRTSVAHLGVDIRRFAPAKDKEEIRKKLHLPVGAFVVGYVGRISPEKNLGVLLSAFQQAVIPEKELVLVGGGQLPHLRSPAVHITGFIANVEEYLKAMDVFVMPSLTETTSLATLEAMASGLPVIVTKRGFMQEYVTKENGLFFPENDARDLARKLERLSEDEVLRKKLGQKVRTTVAYGFSWQRSINRVKRLLLRV